MRLVHLFAVAGIIAASPVHAATTDDRGNGPFHGGSAAAFAAARMTDTELAGIVGTGGGPGFRFLRDTTNVNARLVEQQNGLLLVATFDNWFTDVGSALIFSNIAGSR